MRIRYLFLKKKKKSPLCYLLDLTVGTCSFSSARPNIEERQKVPLMPKTATDQKRKDKQIQMSKANREAHMQGLMTPKAEKKTRTPQHHVKH